MKHKIIMSRTYVTEFEIEAADDEQAKIKFKLLGDAVYHKEMEQCNVVGETIIVESEDDGVRICSITGEQMVEGWVANDGEHYFKYEKDALAWCISQEYEDIQSAYNDDVIYWTEWETPNLINNL
jgi:hypothetical protein